jgi:hypothetical protein
MWPAVVSCNLFGGLPKLLFLIGLYIYLYASLCEAKIQVYLFKDGPYSIKLMHNIK